MDSFFHASHKIMNERTRNSVPVQEIPDVAPPAYSAEYDMTSDDNENEEDEDTDIDPAPMTLTLNASTVIEGEGNLCTGPALADATRFSTLLLAAVQSLNAKAEAEARLAAVDNNAERRVRPTLNVNLVMNCGITINGNRNVVGFKPPPAQAPPAGAVGGGGAIKRKASDEAIEGAPASAVRRVE